MSEIGIRGAGIALDATHFENLARRRVADSIHGVRCIHRNLRAERKRV
jgi:hypothetical protein